MNRRVSTHRRPRAGVTMIELLVVIGILGLLMALLLPAAQQARGTARGMQCKSNLHQIGVAMHSLQEQKGAFPGFDYNSSLLPYLEQAALAEMLIGVGAVHETLEGVGSDEIFQGITIPVLACPSEPAQSIARNRALNYRLNTGTGWGDHEDGFWKRGSGIKPADVTDGLSQTAAFSERLLYRGNEPGIPTDGAFTPTLDQQRRRMAMTDAYYGASQMDEFADACRDDATWFGGVFNGFICTPFSGGCSSHDYNHIMTPNQNSCFNGVAPDDQDRVMTYAAHAPSSMHPGGVHVLLGDGAVRFVSDSVDRTAWRALGTSAGQEPNALSAF